MTLSSTLDKRELAQVAAVVFLGEETGFTIVPALRDVQRDTIKIDAGAAGHETVLADKYIEPGLSNVFKSFFL